MEFNVLWLYEVEVDEKDKMPSENLYRFWNTCAKIYRRFLSLYHVDKYRFSPLYFTNFRPNYDIFRFKPVKIYQIDRS